MRSWSCARARAAPWRAALVAIASALAASVAIASALAVWIALAALPARADEPAPAPSRSGPPSSAPAPRAGATPAPVPRDGPLVIRLALENDNLLLGMYGRIAGHDQDGTDLGRTHATSLHVDYDVADRVALELDASTQLFTRSVDGVLPGRMMTVPIYFHELSRFRLGVGLGRPGAPWRARIGIGLDLSNRDALSVIGASGQQAWWHRFCRYDLGTATWLFEYVPDGGGVHLGAATDLALGGATQVSIADWFWLELDGDAGVRGGTLSGGNWVEVRGRVALGIGERDGARAVLALGQQTYVWLETPGVMLRSTIELRLDVSAFALELALHRYEGDQNEAYFVYVFGNTTMTVALWARF